MPERLRVRPRLGPHDAVEAAAVNELGARLDRLVAAAHPAAAVPEVMRYRSCPVPGRTSVVSFPRAGRTTTRAQVIAEESCSSGLNFTMSVVIADLFGEGPSCTHRGAVAISHLGSSLPVGSLARWTR